MMTIVVAWLVYCGVIAAVLSAGALAWEVSARSSGRQARWGWLAALAGSVTLPWLLRYAPEQAWADVVPAGFVALPSAAVVPFDLVFTGGDAAQQAGGWTATQYTLAAWALMSLLMLAYVGWMLFTLGRARRRWQPADVEGGRVWLSRDVGPAAMGLREGIVVVPSWALSLSHDLRRLLLAHEREHVKAGDPRLLFTGLLLTAAMPWNPLVWLQLLRLRNAIELDCDARVLERGADPRAYGALLLEVGQRRSSSPLVMAAFAEPRVFMEERIRRIASWPLPRRRGRSAGFALVALLLFTTALSARDPLRTPAGARYGGGIDLLQPGAGLVAQPDVVLDGNGDPVMFGLPALEVSAPRPLASDTPPARPRLQDGPTFTPMTVRPELRNVAEVRRALGEAYPPLLRDAGVGGTAFLWFFIGEDGAVRRAEVSRTSGYPALDEAALAVAAVMQFTPARNREEPVPVWVEIPVAFGAPAAPAAPLAPAAPGARGAPGAPGAPLAPAAPGARGAPGAPLAPAAPGAAGGALAPPAPGAPGTPAAPGARGTPLAPAAPAAAGRTAASAAELQADRAAAAESAAARSGRTEGAVQATPAQAARSDAAARAAGDAGIRQQALAAAVQQAQARLLNQAEVLRMLQGRYPPLLRDAGVGGTVVGWFFVDETGRVLRTQLGVSSGRPELDEAVLGTAATMRFEPYIRDGAARQVWVEVPVSFGAGPLIPYTRPQGEVVRHAPLVVPGPAQQPEPRPRVPLARPGEMPPGQEQLAAAPTFTPMTDRPQLRNTAEVQRALVRLYPPLLRDAGIGGTILLWLFVNEDGRVLRTRLAQSSGQPALDAAAEEIGALMEFSPALNRGQRVSVWIQLPVVFTAR
jgi:TonB family protein